mmetsp:Transcript_11104/g.33130  ORF Transcript_11104/g.33130 Transcript_11104/m.33130 type:complete len:179 (-) Transcript_11104:25-561(-)
MSATNALDDGPPPPPPPTRPPPLSPLSPRSPLTPSTPSRAQYVENARRARADSWASQRDIGSPARTRPKLIDKFAAFGLEAEDAARNPPPVEAPVLVPPSPIIYPEQPSDKGSHPSEFLAAAIAWAADEAERDGSLPEIRRSLESSLEKADGQTYNTLLRAELVRRESNASEAASPGE